MNKKNLSLASLFLMVLCVVSACKKDLNLTAPGEAITIAYSILDVKDTKHFVRIEKSFVDQNKNALEMAQISDSIYYPNVLDVKVIDLNTNGAYTLTRVYGDSAGAEKDSGIFASAPNVLYTFNATLNKDHAYKLVVRNTLTGQEISGQIYLANEPKLVYPINNMVNLSMVDTNGLKIRWSTAKYDKVFDLKIQFNYSEWDVATPSIISFKSISYFASTGQASNTTNGNEAMEVKIQRTDLYRQMKIQIPVDPSKQRKINGINTLQFQLFAADEAFYKYVQVKNAQGGITSTSLLPIYTNIQNGLGLLSSRTMVQAGNIGIDGASKDSIIQGTYTKDLNFIP